MSEQNRPECPNTPQYPCGDCPACRAPLTASVIGRIAPEHRQAQASLRLDSNLPPAQRPDPKCACGHELHLHEPVLPGESSCLAEDCHCIILFGRQKAAQPEEIQVDGFKDEHIRLALGRKEAQRLLASLPARSPNRRVLVVLRGLPGSGKSTAAQAIVDSDPSRWARVSKDDLRQMMVGPNGDLFRFVEDKEREAVVSMTAREAAMSALRLGLDVVVDATNLTEAGCSSWRRRVASLAVRVLVCERAIDTPLEECIARDKLRGKRSVGEAVIRRLAATIDLPLADRDWEAGS